MEVSYKRDFHHSYLIIKNQDLPDCEAYSVRMLLNSSIPGLLACKVHKIDNQSLFYYEITSKQTLASMYETQKLDRAMLVLLIGALMRAIEEMEAFLLNPSELLLNPEYIYMNTAEKQIGFVCWPGEADERGDFLKLMEYLLPRIDHQDQDAVVLGYQMYRRALDQQMDPEEIRKELYQEILNPGKEGKQQEVHVENFQEEFPSRQEVLEEVLRNVEEDEKNEPKARPGLCIGIIILLVVMYLYFMKHQFFSWPVFVIIAGVALIGGVIAAIIWLVRKMKQQKTSTEDTPYFRVPEERSKSIDELPDIMEEAQTALLFAESVECCGMLKAVSPSDISDILLGRGTTVVGKLSGAVDVVLPSSVVSRVHAKIKWDEDCVIYDLNSKNGTYVNYTEIIGCEGRLIQEGDMVTFADLVYQYTTQGHRLRPERESTIMGENHYRRRENGAGVLLE